MIDVVEGSGTEESPSRVVYYIYEEAGQYVGKIDMHLDRLESGALTDKNYESVVLALKRSANKELVPPPKGTGQPPFVAMDKPRKYKKKDPTPPSAYVHKGTNRCSLCHKKGHTKRKCPDVGPATNVVEKIEPVEPFEEAPLSAPESPAPVSRITPDKLAKVKRLLGDGENMAFIAMDCGVSEETVERIAVSLGL